ncbi:hypothetical protein ONS95_012849 [Cadophora gregata]|uniref:uncharacterized protein n=1 Tax=Cadophora gregata TaxID=51156 RepID=UPI0026DADCC9|nr:uncharacterized protein ONS95_012849 [Cadophora gregata]KAK0115798.1 hypothetical protein ONS95_012849 [Cadophora gregata]
MLFISSPQSFQLLKALPITATLEDSYGHKPLSVPSQPSTKTTMRASSTLLALLAAPLLVSAWSESLRDSMTWAELLGTNLICTYDYPNEPGVPESFTSSINLHECVGNSNGALVGRSSGYDATCKDCSVSSICRLDCTCTDDDGDEDLSILDLDTFIRNEDGVLTC